MARLTTAILCDFAQVREGLLFVSSGGITRMFRPQLPGPVAAQLAVVIELQPDEIELAHELKVSVVHSETASVIGSITAGVQVGDPGDLRPGETVQVPFVAPLGAFQLPSAGAYDVRAVVDAEPATILTFYVIEGVPGGVTPGPGPA